MSVLKDAASNGLYRLESRLPNLHTLPLTVDLFLKKKKKAEVILSILAHPESLL